MEVSMNKISDFLLALWLLPDSLLLSVILFKNPIYVLDTIYSL
jgi:hypothetical protein